MMSEASKEAIDHDSECSFYPGGVCTCKLDERIRAALVAFFSDGEPDPELVRATAQALYDASEDCIIPASDWSKVQQEYYTELAHAALAAADRWRRERMEQGK